MKDGLPPRFKPWQPPKPKGLEQRQNNAGRWRSSPRDRGYDVRWDRMSRSFRRSNPWCYFCQQERPEEDWQPTAVTDHVLPAREFPKLRYVRTNWCPLCQYHHDSTKAQLEAYARKNNCVALLELWVHKPMTRPTHLRPLALQPGPWSTPSP